MTSRPGRRTRWSDASDDAGFSLLETIVAIFLIGVVMSSISAFLVTSVSVTSQQSGIKGAIQASDDATELVRALKGSALLSGRDSASVDTQWASPVLGVSGYLSTMAKAWDTTAGSGSGATAPLPTTGRSVTVNGVTYAQHWYVGRCWQPDAGGDCGATTGDVPFFRVVVAVTWSERHCPNSACSYVTTTLVSSAPRDPLFNANETATAPTVTNPGNQTGQAGVADTLQLAASGGVLPLTWTATGLPDGLTMSTTGLISGTPSAAGTFSVLVRATDGFGLFGTAAFTWTVNPPVQITTPGAQTAVAGVAVSSLQIVATAGTAPYTWSATGLPDGLSINSSGRIVGTPTVAGTYADVRVTVTDSATGTATTNPFTWTVSPALAVASPTEALAANDGTAFSVQATATGGLGPYVWTGSNLPNGMNINSSGQVSGTPTRGTRWLTTLRVTDSTGATASVTIPWVVNSGTLGITDPVTDRTDARGTYVAITPNTGGTAGGPRTWSATGLPNGLSMDSNGGISGTLTTAGTYTLTITVVRGGERATSMFRWTVT
jgi:prepilin-type N-terminal cleavage/methylation domain-containing protein